MFKVIKNKINNIINNTLTEIDSINNEIRVAEIKESIKHKSAVLRNINN